MAGNKHKPVILFPLRLELSDRTVSQFISKPPIKPKFPFISQSKPITLRRREICLRWYPDTCQVFPPQRGISADEQSAFKKYWEKIRNITEPEVEETAWLGLVREIGLSRAKYLSGLGEKALQVPTGESLNAFGSFMENGAGLKILPLYVRVYTLHAKNPGEPIFLAEGNTIPRDLVLSPNQDNPLARWTYDFEAAVKVGMGVLLTDVQQCAQFDDAQWLIALGFQEDPSNDELLKELFTLYREQSELEVLAQDTPTNNTENAKTGYTGYDSDTEAERQSESAESNWITDINSSRILATAFGVEDVFKSTPGSELFDQRSAIAMNNLLWYGCTTDYRNSFMNYSVPHGINPSGIYRMEEDHSAWMHLVEYFRSYVLGRGMAPALRIGENPYGILPVTSLKKWTPQVSLTNERYPLLQTIHNVCQSFKGKFLDEAGKTPSLTNSADNQKFETLMEVLQREPVSNRVDVQKIFFNNFKWVGRELEKYSGSYVDSDPKLIAEIIEEAREYYRNIIKIDYFIYIGFRSPQDPETWYFDSVQFEKDFSAITKLRQKIESSEMSLLHRLLLLAASKLDTELMTTAVQAEQCQITNNQPEYDRKVELYKTLKNWAENMLNEFMFIQDRTTEELKTLMMEVFDCLSNRLDAWILSLANQNLFQLEFGRKEGIYRRKELADSSMAPLNLLGVYGWMEKPSDLNKDQGQEGYFQAPSLNQGTAGAIMASAALSASDPNQGTFQINLSSNRVKLATWFIEGLQKGFRQEELLGYRVERLLHELELDYFLLNLRKGFPLSDQDGQVGVKDSRIVDGEKFRQATWPEILSASGLDKMSAVELLRAGFISRSHVEQGFGAIQAELNQIRDAVADLSVAETLYQTVQGNAPRLTAWLEVAEGKNIPPVPEVNNTPRTGIPQMQRVGLPFCDVTGAISQNTVNPLTLAEPVLANYCAWQLTGYDQAKLIVTASLLTTPVPGYTGSTSISYEISPRYDLDLEAVDLVYGGQPELEHRVKIYLWRQLFMNPQNWSFLKPSFFKEPSFEGLAEQITIELNYQFPAVPGVPTMETLIHKATLAHQFLKSSRPLEPENLTTIESGELTSLIKSKMAGYRELSARCERLFKRLLEDFEELSSIHSEIVALNPNVSGNIAGCFLRAQEKLMKFSKYGFSEALVFLSPPISETYKKDVLALVTAILNKVKKRLGIGPQVVTEVVLEGGSTGKMLICLKDDLFLMKEMKLNGTILNKDWVKLDLKDEAIQYIALNKMIQMMVEQLQQLTVGEKLVILPPFLTVKELSITDTDQTPHGDRYQKHSIKERFSQFARVRRSLENLMKLDLEQFKFMVYSDLGVQKSLAEAVSQAVHQLGNQPRPNDKELASLTIPKQSHTDLHYLLPEGGVKFSGGELMAGLIIDEWTDFIPNETETTGLVFKHRTPKAEAPQAILIAVPPVIDPHETWSDKDVAEIISETIDLMLIRAVTPEEVAGSNLRYFLPTLLYGLNFKTEPLATVKGTVEGGYYYTAKP